MGQVWPDHYGPGGPGAAQADLKQRCRSSGLPYGLLACQDGAVVGLGALDAASCGSRPDEAAWLVGLCVAPGHQGQGIASEIVQAAMGQAALQGHDALFATTQSAVGLLRRAGWQDLRGWENADGAWRVLKAAL